MRNPILSVVQFAIVLAIMKAQTNAAVLTALPNAMAQGGMVHIDVVFKNQSSGTFSSSLEFGGSVVPDMKPLTLWSPGDTIDPAKAYYDEIDPTQSAMWFSSRWGFRIDTDNSDPRPAGTSLGIRLISATPNLSAFFYNNAGNGTFQPVFTPSHNYVLWSGAMWHPYFTMPSSTPYNTLVSATFEFFLADTSNSGDVDYTTNAGYAAGYSVGTQTITWTAIPEPDVLALVGVSATAFIALIRKRRNL